MVGCHKSTMVGFHGLDCWDKNWGKPADKPGTTNSDSIVGITGKCGSNPLRFYHVPLILNNPPRGCGGFPRFRPSPRLPPGDWEAPVANIRKIGKRSRYPEASEIKKSSVDLVNPLSATQGLSSGSKDLQLGPWPAKRAVAAEGMAVLIIFNWIWRNEEMDAFNVFQY